METLATHGDVQAVKYEGGAHHLYEVDPATGKKNHLSSDDYLESLGYEPTPSEYAREAVAATLENTGATPIPVIDAAEITPATPLGEGAAAAHEIGQNMDAQADELVRRLEQILPGREEVNRTIDERFEQLSRQMNERFEDLSQRFDQLNTPNDGNTLVMPPAQPELAHSETPDATGNAPVELFHENPAELGNSIGNPGRAEIRGQARDGTPFIYRRREDGQWEFTRNGNLGNEWFIATPQQIAQELGLGDLAPQTPQPAEGPTEPDPTEQPTEVAQAIAEDNPTEINETVEDNSLRGRARRAWDRMRNIATGRSALAAVHSRDAERVESTTTDRERRRSVLGFLAGGILIGAAGVEIIEHYLEGKHGIPNPHISHHIREHASGLGPNHLSHTEHFRGAFGHNRTGVELSGALHLKHLPTHDIIVDNQGHTIVGQLKEGIGDKQGNLSHAAKEILKAKGYKITQNGFEGSDGVFRYMSEVT